MITYGHFIGGKHVAGTSGRFADVFQPMDGTVRGKVALASVAAADGQLTQADLWLQGRPHLLATAEEALAVQELVESMLEGRT